MENERQSMHKEQGEEPNVDERLAAFYGPSLPEQPLSAEAWMRLQAQLSTRSFPAKRLVQHLLRYKYRRTYSDRLPSIIEHTFASLVYEARLPQQRFSSRILRYSLKRQRRVPIVRTSLIGRGKIKLVLSLQPPEPPELDVLLATGLARLRCMQEPTNLVRYLLLLSIEPLALLIFLIFWLRGLSLPFLPIAIMLLLLMGLGVIWSLHLLKRSIAMRADLLMVQWIGRSRACEGLHLLAGRVSTFRRSHWGEPTLEERIARVCGTRVTVEHEPLTMVR